MVILLNGGLSDGSSSKRPLENAYCSSSSVLEVKYKPRKVFCIRDYPPGCGRNAPPFNLRQKENVVALVGDKENLVDGERRTDVVVADCVRTSEVRAEFQYHEVLKSQIRPEMAESSSGLAGNVVDMPGMVSEDEKVSTNMEALGVGSWKDLECVALELSKKLHEVEVQTLVKREDATEDEAVLEIGASDDVMVSVANAKKFFPQHWPIGDANVSEETVLKKKYPRRSVSATRDYPPLCGRTAPCPNEEDLRVASRNKSFGGTERAGAEGRPLRETVEAGVDDWQLSKTARAGVVESKRVVRDGNAQKSESRGTVPEPRNKSQAFSPNCLWKQGKGASKTRRDGGMTRIKLKTQDFTRREKSRIVVRKNNSEANYSRVNSSKGKSMFDGKAAYGDIGALPAQDEEASVVHDFNVRLPRCYGPQGSNCGDARYKVRKTLCLFQTICRKLLQGEEATLRQSKRIDLQAIEIVKEKGKEVNTGKQILGAVAGVEVGDEFQYRVELALIGVHRMYQGGIDYVKYGGEIIATSIVASGGYDDDLDNADVLIYSGQGGNLVGHDKQPEDQKLIRGNLALKNSISVKNPVRVIRGFREAKASDSSNARAKTVMTYTYDGLYIVKRYWQEPGPHGKLVYKFELRRIPGQPELAWKEVKNSKKYKIRKGLCVDDISGGKERFPICAVNSIDNEKPPSFTYMTRMIYPNWYRLNPPKGCDCTDGCLDPEKCSCAVKNGGKIPYNHNGAIVEVKTLVYECGPSCKCPPSCCNRVSQHGMKIQLEIFKTVSRGWGVRSLTSIPSGSFICEYTGELLEDKEADQRIGFDEYLFDIGQNYNDCDETQTLKLDAQSSFSEVDDDVGFTIDAAQYGTVGRFINHSCSPNLYAQNVLHDHDDRRMPHIMLFAADNIPPLQELSYHYNCMVNQIRDSNGNIKVKRCYCGSTLCTGRMY